MKKKIFYVKNMVFIYLLLLLLYLRIFEKKYMELSKPKVSVFLPIYNKEKYIIRSINSIRSQTLKDIEINAINDCSTDNTLKILKKLSKKDKRIKIINNDRNHGLLYSRAMGIIKSSGEYLINLDPDDKFNSNSDIKILYNKAKKSKLDYIIYKVKRIPRYKSQIKTMNLINKLQFQKKDYLITNKFIKREIFIMSYHFFKNNIYKYKWNYHEDNIWNILTRIYGKTSKIINKYIYIYKKNNDSLMINKKGNPIEIKNRIYRLQNFIKIIQVFQINNSNIYYDKYYNDYIKIYKKYKSSLLSFNEIKNDLINISLSFLYIYNNRKDIINNINYILNSFQKNKIIIFFSSINKNIFDYLTYVCIYKYLQENNERRVISVNINNNNQIKAILNYIYPNDIIFGLNNLIFQNKFLKIIKKFNKNKIILLNNNIYRNFINRNTYNSSSNLFIYSFNTGSNDITNIKLCSLSNNIINLANYFNYVINLKNINNNYTVFFDNYNNRELEVLESIIHQKLEENQTIFNLTKIFHNIKNIKNLIDIINIIRKSKIIITDNFYIMKLSALSFVSCLLYGNITENKNVNVILKLNLNYIKYIDDINKLEKQLIYLEDKSKENNEYDIKKDLKDLNLEIKI
jgi:glycosyltransferase involved in cell wall biosynthesis